MTLSPLSISRYVTDLLPEQPRRARLLAVFAHAWDMVTADGEVVALVAPQVGNGPLNIVLPALPGGVQPGAAATLSRSSVTVGPLRVKLGGAEVWEPRPDWESLRGQGGVGAARLEEMRALCLAHAPDGSLLALLDGHTARPPRQEVLLAARRGAELVCAARHDDPAPAQAGAALLAGLGGGLTPAGDDFLAGAMLRAWLEGREWLCPLLGEAAEQTTLLSAALLRAAARGEASAAWHTLLAALGTGGSLDAAVRDVLAVGSTSGADTAAGFLAGQD